MNETQAALEKELNQLRAKLEEKIVEVESLNKELGTLSYSISHDLKSPLRLMDGFTTILKDDYKNVLDADGQQLVDRILANSAKMGQLVDGLLEYSRAQRQEINPAKCNMNELVQVALNEQPMTLRQRNYEIKIDELHACNGDFKMLLQVWIKLISNALKFSGKAEKPVIEIGSYRDTDKNVYFVKDNGAGFDMAYADKLFGVFQRLHSPREFEGIGIGLAIVYRIVSRHGGKVWVEAQKDKGASFYFSLPAA